MADAISSGLPMWPNGVMVEKNASAASARHSSSALGSDATSGEVARLLSDHRAAETARVTLFRIAGSELPWPASSSAAVPS
jgi:hypothetical protein